MTKFTVTKVKTFRGHDGLGWNCTLMMDGKPIAEVHDGAYGGEPEFTWLDRAHEKALRDHCKTLPPHKDKQYPNLPALDITYDMFVADLVNEQLMAKEDAKIAKKFLTHVCFHRDGDSKGSFTIVKIPPTPENKKLMRDKYGRDIVFLDEAPKDWRKIIVD